MTDTADRADVLLALEQHLCSLLSRATKRSWRVFDSFDGTDVGKRYERPNAELIVEAVNALPVLLDALASRDAEIAALRAIATQKETTDAV